MILATHGFLASSIGQFDADAVAFFDRVTTAGGTLSLTEKNAVNTLVIQMKTDGIWTKMKAIYPMVGASAAACSQNLKSSSFTGTFTSGWTFASTGATPNGTSAYMNTNLIPSTSLSLNSVSHSVYCRTAALGLMGGVNISGGGFLIINNPTATNFTTQLNTIGADFIDVTVSNITGLILGNRTTSTVVNGWRNGVKLLTDSKDSFALPNLNYYIGARNNNGSASNFDSKQYAFYQIGDGLTDDEALDFYNAVNDFQVALNRNV
jgi:hypothetical protein